MEGVDEKHARTCDEGLGLAKSFQTVQEFYWIRFAVGVAKQELVMARHGSV